MAANRLILAGMVKPERCAVRLFKVNKVPVPVFPVRKLFWSRKIMLFFHLFINVQITRKCYCSLSVLHHVCFESSWEACSWHNIGGRSYWPVWELNPLLELHLRLDPYSKSLHSLQGHQAPLPVTVRKGLLESAFTHPSPNFIPSWSLDEYP